MDTFFNLIHIVLAGLLIGAILLQQRGGGLGGIFGGESQIYATRRGIEKGIFISTIILAVLFLTSAVVRILLS